MYYSTTHFNDFSPGNGPKTEPMGHKGVQEAPGFEPYTDLRIHLRRVVFQLLVLGSIQASKGKPKKSGRQWRDEEPLGS